MTDTPSPSGDQPKARFRELLIAEHDELVKQHFAAADAETERAILEKIGDLEMVLFYGDFDE